MAPGVTRPRPLHSIRLALGAALCLLVAAFVPAAVSAETPEETAAYLESVGFACEPSADIDGVACERQFGADDTDRDQASLFAFGAGRSAGVGRASFGEPWGADIESVAVRVVESTCPGLGARVSGIVAEARSVAAPTEVEEIVGPCRLRAEIGELGTDVGQYRSVGIEIFNDAATATASLVPSVDTGDGPRGAILAGLLAAGWTCTQDALEFGGAPYDGTECRSGDADERDQDIVRVANVGSVGVQSGVMGSSMAPALAPWSPSLDALAVEIFELACPGSGGRVAELVASLDAGQDGEIEDGPCFFDAGRGGTTIGDEERIRTYLVSVISTQPLGAEPEPSAAAPSALPSASAPGGAPIDPGTDPGETAIDAAVPAFTRAIPTPAAVVTEPSIVATSAILAMLAVLLVPFPGMLFNSTLESNYDEIRGWFRRGRRPAVAATAAADVDSMAARDFWRSPLGIVVFLLLSAVLYGFLDPDFGTGPSTIPMYVGTVIGLSAITMLAFAGPWSAHARLGVRGTFRALPGTLIVAAVCVLISRVTGFLPGYLYGLLLALEFARSLDRDEGRLAAISAATLLGAAGLAWLGLGLLPDDAGGPVGAILMTALGAIVVAGLEGVVFGLVPLRFLPGLAVFAWNRVVWAALYGIGVFGFLHVLLDPEGGYLASSARTPLFTIVALLVGFGVVSVAFWGYFRLRPSRDAPTVG